MSQSFKVPVLKLFFIIMFSEIVLTINEKLQLKAFFNDDD